MSKVDKNYTNKKKFDKNYGANWSSEKETEEWWEKGILF